MCNGWRGLMPPHWSVRAALRSATERVAGDAQGRLPTTGERRVDAAGPDTGPESAGSILLPIDEHFSRTASSRAVRGVRGERAMPPRQAAPVGGSPSQLGSTPADRMHGARARRATADFIQRLGSSLADRICDGDGVGSAARGDGGEMLVVSLPLDTRGPAAARSVVDGLQGRIPPAVLQDARLVVSELVTNSVRHSAASVGVAMLSVHLTATMLRLEVRDPGCGRAIAPGTTDLERGWGLGLDLVRAVSERWGLEQIAVRGTRVWAQLPVRVRR